jgi:alpha-glucosidase
MALPGAMYIYQGEELGLPEVDLPRDRLQDPMYHRSNGTRPGRDGCRVPLPWSGDAPPYGFSPAGSAAEPWLPQPADWAGMTVSAERENPLSMLSLYRQGLGLRRDRWATADSTLVWLDLGIADHATDSPEGPSADSPAVLAFRRGDLACVVNFGPGPVALPRGEVLLTSGPLIDGLLPPDTTAWLGLGTESGPHEKGHRPGPTAENTIS